MRRGVPLTSIKRYPPSGSKFLMIGTWEAVPRVISTKKINGEKVHYPTNITNDGGELESINAVSKAFSQSSAASCVQTPHKERTKVFPEDFFSGPNPRTAGVVSL